MGRNDDRFLMKIVDMYYKQDMSQEKIRKASECIQDNHITGACPGKEGRLCKDTD